MKSPLDYGLSETCDNAFDRGDAMEFLVALAMSPRQFHLDDAGTQIHWDVPMTASDERQLFKNVAAAKKILTYSLRWEVYAAACPVANSRDLE